MAVERLDDHRFAGLLEAAPDAMVCVDADGRIALVNAQTERLFGYGRDEMVGQPVEMLVPDAVRDAHPAHRAGYVAHPAPRPRRPGVKLAGPPPLEPPLPPGTSSSRHLPPRCVLVPPPS